MVEHPPRVALASMTIGKDPCMKTKALAVLALLLLLPRYATGDVTFLTSRAGLGGDDSIDWGVLGPEGSHLLSPQTVVTNRGLTVTVSSSSGDLRRYDQYCVPVCPSGTGIFQGN